MEKVLYQKFIQHPPLCSLLLSTGMAELVYGEITDRFWGGGVMDQGLNMLGKALMSVRDRLRAEGLASPPAHSAHLHSPY